MSQQRDKTRLATPFRFAMGMLGTSIAMSMVGSRGTFFYTEFWGLGLQYIALVNIAYAIWDAINDPLFGFLSDRTRTRLGRRKPWLLVAAPLYLICSVVFFTPPAGIAGNVIIIAVYYTVFRILSETLGTILGVNYHSLLPELFKDERGRTSANAIRQALQIVGMIIGIAVVPLVIDKLGYAVVALVTGGLGILCFLYSILGCREDPEYASAEMPKLLPSLRSILRRGDFWTVGIAHLFLDATNTLAIGSIPFYVRYALGGPSSHETFLSGAIFVIAIPAMWLAAKLVHRFGARVIWRFSMLGMSFGFILMYFTATLLQSVCAGILVGICFAGVGSTLDLMQSRIMDEDTISTGMHREGLIFSTLTFIRKLSGLLISLVFFLIFVVYGFESGANPGPRPDEAARSMMTLIPAILTLLAFVVSSFARFRDWKPAGEQQEQKADSVSY